MRCHFEPSGDRRVRGANSEPAILGSSPPVASADHLRCARDPKAIWALGEDYREEATAAGSETTRAALGFTYLSGALDAGEYSVPAACRVGGA